MSLKFKKISYTGIRDIYLNSSLRGYSIGKHIILTSSLSFLPSCATEDVVIVFRTFVSYDIC